MAPSTPRGALLRRLPVDLRRTIALLRRLPVDLRRTVASFAQPTHPCKYDIDAYEFGWRDVDLAQSDADPRAAERLLEEAYNTLPTRVSPEVFPRTVDQHVPDPPAAVPRDEDWYEAHGDFVVRLWRSRGRRRASLLARRPHFGPGAPYPTLIVVCLISWSSPSTIREDLWRAVSLFWRGVCGPSCRAVARRNLAPKAPSSTDPLRLADACGTIRMCFEVRALHSHIVALAEALGSAIAARRAGAAGRGGGLLVRVRVLRSTGTFESLAAVLVRVLGAAGEPRHASSEPRALGSTEVRTHNFKMLSMTP